MKIGEKRKVREKGIGIENERDGGQEGRRKVATSVLGRFRGRLVGMGMMMSLSMWGGREDRFGQGCGLYLSRLDLFLLATIDY